VRAFLFVVASVLLLGGAVAIAEPKTAVVAHPGTRYKAVSIEVVSPRRSIVYGSLSLTLGAIALFGAVSWEKWKPR